MSPLHPPNTIASREKQEVPDMYIRENGRMLTFLVDFFFFFAFLTQEVGCSHDLNVVHDVQKLDYLVYAYNMKSLRCCMKIGAVLLFPGHSFGLGCGVKAEAQLRLFKG